MSQMDHFPRPQSMPHNYEALHFDDSGFPGFVAMGWTSAPIHLTDQLVTLRDENELRELLLRLFPEWNFVDHDGNDVPHTLEGFDALPQSLVSAMIRKHRLATMGIPNEQGTPEILGQGFSEPS